MPFTSHLEELRSRLLKCCLALGVGFDAICDQLRGQGLQRGVCRDPVARGSLNLGDLGASAPLGRHVVGVSSGA